MVEQKAESKGRSQMRGRKVAVLCGMQLEMVAGEKNRDAVKGCWRKHAE